MEYQSHFAVYALILDEAKTSALLIRKALGCYTGLYDLPGGSLEPHELLEDALRREVLEETDCAVTALGQMTTFSVLYPFVKEGKNIVLRHIGTIYRAEVTGTPRAEGSGEDDSHGCVWVPLAEITDANAAPFVVQAVRFLSR